MSEVQFWLGRKGTGTGQGNLNARNGVDLEESRNVSAIHYESSEIHDENSRHRGRFHSRTYYVQWFHDLPKCKSHPITLIHKPNFVTS